MVQLRGGSRANLKEGQLVVGALKNFQKLVTRVRCMQQYQIYFRGGAEKFSKIGDKSTLYATISDLIRSIF